MHKWRGGEGLLADKGALLAFGGTLSTQATVSSSTGCTRYTVRTDLCSLYIASTVDSQTVTAPQSPM